MRARKERTTERQEREIHQVGRTRSMLFETERRTTCGFRKKREIVGKVDKNRKYIVDCMTSEDFATDYGIHSVKRNNTESKNSLDCNKLSDIQPEGRHHLEIATPERNANSKNRKIIILEHRGTK